MSGTTHVGALLKRYRQAAGLSQEALAAGAGISARAVSDIERGVHQTPHGATLDLLASALDLPPQRRALLLAAGHPETSASDQPDSAAPVAPPARVGSLPAPPGPLTGRARELARASEWVGEAGRRMLTLTGPGGVGKTRLALEIAHIHRQAFAGGAVFVDLSPLRDAQQVPSAIALALGLADEPKDAPGARVATYLSARHTLLVLDNAERVTGAALFLADLLAQCPNLRLLVTSRLPLRLRAERVLPIDPLPAEDAEALFQELRRDTWRGAAYDAPAIAAICARLDGLPLAIELAAAQSATLPPEILARRLTDRLGSLRGGPRDLPAHQRTMEVTLDWSYDLLTGEQQAALRALSVFAGGWTLEAARAVLSIEPEVTLAALVEASLVMLDAPLGGATRWRLLDITREYARGRLAAEEEDTLMRRLATYFANEAETVLMRGPELAIGRGDLDLPTVRAALGWAERRREADLGLRLAGFARVWHARGQVVEAIDVTERMLALDASARANGEPAAPPAMRVSRLYGAARSLMGYGEPQRAEARLHEALFLASAIQDHQGLSEAFASLGDLARTDGRLDLAIAAYTESYAHARHAPGDDPPYRALVRLADLAQLRGDLDQAGRYLDDALAPARAASSWETGMILTRLGRLASAQGQRVQASARYQESLAIFRTYDESSFTAWALEGLASTFSAAGRHATAIRLYAGAAAIRQRANAPPPPAEHEVIEADLDRARLALGEPAFHAAWTAGSALPLDALIGETISPARVPRRPARADGRRPPGH